MHNLLLIAALQLHALFSDNMVLQREHAVPVYGNGRPGAQVAVQIESATAAATVLPDGRWKVILPAFPAGGPHQMDVSMDDPKLHFKNILFGDLWLASGQSNMAFHVSDGVLNQKQEIANAGFEKVRFFNVPESLAAKPGRELPGGKWEICSPMTVGACSAVAYFFARDVFKATGVPVGILSSAVGGTAVDAWMSPAALERFPKEKRAWVERLNAEHGSWENYVKTNGDNIQRMVHSVDTSMEALAAGVLDPAFDDSKWKPVELFNARASENCIWWLRKKISLTKEQTAKAMVLSLAKPDFLYKIYVNGTKLAEERNKPCKLDLPPGTFKEGDNWLTMRLASYWGVPCFSGNPRDVFLRAKDDSSEVSIMTGWKYSDAMEPPLAKWLPMASIPSCLYNGKISPLLESPIKGVIWYQGEQNTGQPEAYAPFFSAMISDWRIQYRQGYFPFYFVQLANFGHPSELPENTGWALLREAQSKALMLPETGMATAIDCGEELDIHPRNKQAVGHRLALQALAQTYGMALESYGPIFERFTTDGNKLIVRFRHAKGLKTKDGHAPQGFSVAGDDHAFYLATTAIDGETVVLSSDKVLKPTAVRYGFSGNPVGNMCNDANLPLYPFRTDEWNQISLGK